MVSATTGSPCPNFFMRLFGVICLALLLGHNMSFGQSSNDGFIHYTVNDGLPSSEVHDVCQDADGLIWMATDRGMCSFDGYDFRIYGPEDGMKEQTVWRVLKDSFQRIWFIGLSGRLHFYQNGRFTAYKHNALLKEHDKGNVLRLLYSMGKDTLYLQYNGYDKVFQIDLRTLEFSVRSIFEYQTRVKLLKLNGKLAAFRGRGKGMYLDWGSRIDLSSSISSLVQQAPYFSQTDDSTALVSIGGDLMEVGQGKMAIKKVLSPHRLLSIEQHQTSALHLCHDNFISQYHDGQIDTLLTFSPEVAVSGCYRDLEGGHWVATLDNGVYYSPGVSIHQTRRWEVSDRVTALMGKGDELFIGTKNEGLFVLRDGKQILKYPGYGWVNGIDTLGGGVLITTTQPLKAYGPYKNFGANVSRGAQYYWKMDPRTLSYGLNGLDWTNMSALDGYRTYAVQKYGDRWLLGTSEGVFEFDGTRAINLGIRFKELSARVSDMVLIDSVVWISTIGKGVVLYTSDSIRSLRVGNSLLPSDYCNDIHVDDQENVWISTNSGLVRVAEPKSPDLERGLQVFTVRDGLTNNEVLICESHNGFLYIGSKDGLDRIRLNSSRLPKKNHYHLSINHLSSRGKLLAVKAEHKLNANFNDIQIGFKGLCFRCLGQLEYQYRILGLSDDWISTFQTKVDLFNLLPGDYRFELKCIGYKMNPSETVSFDFEILAPWYSRTWFQVGLFVLLIITGLAIAQMIVRRKQLMRRLKSYQYSTFTSQLNPHFIFNSLNNIQSLFLKREVGLGVRYMSSFSLLLRGTLENPDREQITLSEELEQVERYVEMEGLRASHELDLEMIVDPQLRNMSVYVPPMLLQPLVENSINHGIAPKGLGTISIRIFSKEGFLEFVVEDDGIGIEQASKIIKTDSRKSYGLELTKNRIEIINKMNNSQGLFTVVDLSATGGTGTRIRFRLPLTKTSKTMKHDKNNTD